MKEKITALKATARLAGLLYFVLGISAYYALMYVPNKLIVQGNANATAEKLLANEFLYRTGIASHLVSMITFLLFAFVLYKLFKDINRQKAKLLIALVAVQVPIVFLLETLNMTALMIIKADIFTSLSIGQRRDLAMLLLKIHDYGIMILEIFWGLWLVPFGQLVYKSVFIPRIFGVLLLAAGVGYTIDSLTFILFPQYGNLTQTIAFVLSGLGEGSVILWLLIRGAKDRLSITIFSETEANTKSRTDRVAEYI